LARGGALTAILEVLCVALEAQLPGTMCSVLLLDGERGVLKSGAAPSLPPSYAEALNGMAIGEAAGSCGTAARTGPQVLVSEIRTDPRWAQFRELAESFQIRSCWSTPLIGASGIVLGTFVASLRVARAPTQRELQIIELGAHLASIAVDNRAEQEDKYRFESMSAQSKEMMAFVDKDFVYRAVNQSYLDAFGVRREDVIGRTLPEVLGDTFFRGHIKGLHERCHQGETVSRQLWTEQPLLGRRFVDVNYVPAKSDEGDILGVVVGIRDLSDHENALVRLRESETRFRDFAEIAADWFWETDAEHRFTAGGWYSTRISLANNSLVRDPERDLAHFCLHGPPRNITSFEAPMSKRGETLSITAAQPGPRLGDAHRGHRAGRRRWLPDL
jgi:PAS domain S-box-containing protein